MISRLLPKHGLRGGVLALALALLFSAVPALASSYLLDGIPLIVSQAEARLLGRVGVRTTDDLVRRGATSQGRELLSRSTGIAPPRILLLSALSDLMRLGGIGPDAATVINAAGCHSIAELQRASPQALADEIRRVNGIAHLTKNPPRAENLAAWIAKARNLSPFFDGWQTWPMPDPASQAPPGRPADRVQ